ncbi:MAG TPA: GNAT family N-acetyltransferase [Cyanobacteria bacterium UBA11049]|nr:GNAT family N-acetyltransferase [Cyanobacteria bacterium UBA11049]
MPTIVYLPIHKTLRDGTPVELGWMRPQEQEAVRSLLNRVILEGQTYPQDRPLSVAEFVAYWESADAFVVRGAGEVLGAFYLKPNFPGRCSHISNAGFIVQPAMRGLGIGRFMGEEMLKIATSLGYSAVMFNLVFETNIPSIRLWESLGFATIGRIPKAVKLFDGSLVDALMMYKELGARKG